MRYKKLVISFQVKPICQSIYYVIIFVLKKSYWYFYKCYKYEDEVIDVEEISKRNLGKMIVLCIGLESVQERQSLRPLLQACIDFLQTKSEKVWKNASITILNKGGKMYKITCGKEKYQFICQMENGEPSIKENTLVSEHKKPKLNHMLLADKKHFSFQKVRRNTCIYQDSSKSIVLTWRDCALKQVIYKNSYLGGTFWTDSDEFLSYLGGIV